MILSPTDKCVKNTWLLGDNVRISTHVCTDYSVNSRKVHRSTEEVSLTHYQTTKF